MIGERGGVCRGVKVMESWIGEGGYDCPAMRYLESAKAVRVEYLGFEKGCG